MVRSFVLAIALLLATAAPTSAGTNSLESAIRNVRHDNVALSAILQRVANERARELIVSYSHWGPGARQSRGRLSCWWWGEILAANHYPTQYAIPEAIQQWLGSPGHRAILLGRWRYYAAAESIGPNGMQYFVAIFGTPGDRDRDGDCD